MLVVVDDFADDPTFSRQSKMLHAHCSRGRHNIISTITATQKFSSVAPIIRVNATEIETFIDEVLP